MAFCSWFVLIQAVGRVSQPGISFRAWNFGMGGDIGWQQMELLHFRSPGNHLRAIEHTGVIESSDLNQDGTWSTLRTCGEMDSAVLAEVPRGRPGMVPVGERLRSPFRELKRLSFNRHEKVPGATGNSLARPTVAQSPHKWRALALVADFTAVAPSGEYRFRCAHFCKASGEPSRDAAALKRMLGHGFIGLELSLNKSPPNLIRLPDSVQVTLSLSHGHPLP
jgi:hypothetical protein